MPLADNCDSSTQLTNSSAEIGELDEPTLSECHTATLGHAGCSATNARHVSSRELFDADQDVVSGMSEVLES